MPNKTPLKAIPGSTHGGGESKPLVPIWPGYLYEGKMSFLDGPPGSGKTTLLCDLAARISTGRKMPLSDFKSEPRMVVMAITEDDIGDTIIPRLEAARADRDLVRFANSVINFESEDFMDMIREHRYKGRAPVILIETLVHHLPHGTLLIDENSVRTAMNPAMDACRRTRAAMLGAKHWNKKQNANLINRGGGSIGFNAIARSVFSCCPQHGDSTSQLVSAKDGPNPRPFPLTYQLKTGHNGTVCIGWLRQEKSHAPELTPTLAHAVTHLLKVFEVEGSVIDSKVALSACRAGGLSQYAIEQAKTHLHVLSEKIMIFRGPWVWCLPKGENLQVLLKAFEGKLLAERLAAQTLSEGRD